MIVNWERWMFSTNFHFKDTKVDTVIFYFFVRGSVFFRLSLVGTQLATWISYKFVLLDIFKKAVIDWNVAFLEQEQNLNKIYSEIVVV